LTDEALGVAGVPEPAAAPAQRALAVYAISEVARELRQSEIITDLSQFTYDPTTRNAVETKVPYSIVLAQDCDLLRDFEASANGKPLCLNGVLVYELEPSERAKQQLQRGVSWQRVTQNNDERFHCLPDVPATADACQEGLPSLILGF